MTVSRLTICTPAYNADRFLGATLDTIRAQTFTEWEHILVEDGSRDRTEELFNAFSAQVAQRTRFLRHEKNVGLPATRNTAIALAQSEWIVLLDSDDLWTPSHLADLVSCAKRHPEAELVHAGSVLFDSDTGRELEIRAPSTAVSADYPLSLFLGDYIVQPSSVMLKKSLWSRVGGFDPSFRHVEDREMWMRCAQAGARFAYTGANSCLYRKHAAALSTEAGPMAVAAARVFDKALNWSTIPTQLRQNRAAEAWTSAGRILLRRDPQTARDYFARAWQHRPSPRLAAYRVVAALLRLRSSGPGVRRGPIP